MKTRYVMKWMSVFAFVMFVSAGIAQTSEVGNNGETCEKLSNGDVKVTGVDPFGAQVTVVYNKQLEKVFQERTLAGETTFAKFNGGTVVEYGTIYKPLAADIK